VVLLVILVQLDHKVLLDHKAHKVMLVSDLLLLKLMPAWPHLKQTQHRQVFQQDNLRLLKPATQTTATTTDCIYGMDLFIHSLLTYLVQLVSLVQQDQLDHRV
jgi:hypothetical protein